MDVDIGLMLAALVGLAGFVVVLVKKFMPSPARPTPPQKPADPEAEQRALDHADEVIEERTAELNEIDDITDPAERTRQAGAAHRRRRR